MAGSKFDPDATTRGQQKQKDDEAAAAEAAAKKPKMAKGVTMAATAKVCCYGITKICPCNNLRFFFALKFKIFSRIFFIFFLIFAQDIDTVLITLKLL